MANIWTSDIRYCWGIDWSSNSDYLGLIQSYNYGWRLTWSSGPGGWEWYSDGTSITIYNTSTGETVDRLTMVTGMYVQLVIIFLILSGTHLMTTTSYPVEQYLMNIIKIHSLEKILGITMDLSR